MMSGRSRHSSLVNRIAGCNALKTVSVALGLGTHLKFVTLIMV